MTAATLRRSILAAALFALPVNVFAVDATKPETPAKPVKAKKPADRSEVMDYGPFLNLALMAKGPGENNTYKSVAIPLGSNEKGEPSHAGNLENPPAAVCFDEDLLRYSAAWTGGFIDYEGVTFKGAHGRNPAIRR